MRGVPLGITLIRLGRISAGPSQIPVESGRGTFSRKREKGAPDRHRPAPLIARARRIA